MPENVRRKIALASAVIVGAVSAIAIQLSTGSLTAALIALVAALLAGAVSLAITPAPGPPVAAAPTAPVGDPVAVAERARLVAASLYLRDRLTSTALTERLDRELAGVGVMPVTPVGERFDPAAHAAEGAVPTTEAALVGTIAAVEAPGWADRGVPLRPPSVTVYQPARADTAGRRALPGQAS